MAFPLTLTTGRHCTVCIGLQCVINVERLWRLFYAVCTVCRRRCAYIMWLLCRWSMISRVRMSSLAFGCGVFSVSLGIKIWKCDQCLTFFIHVTFKAYTELVVLQLFDISTRQFLTRVTRENNFTLKKQSDVVYPHCCVCIILCLTVYCMHV